MMSLKILGCLTTKPSVSLVAQAPLPENRLSIINFFELKQNREDLLVDSRYPFCSGSTPLMH